MVSEKIKNIKDTLHLFPTTMMGLEYLVDLGKISLITCALVFLQTPMFI